MKPENPMAENPKDCIVFLHQNPETPTQHHWGPTLGGSWDISHRNLRNDGHNPPFAKSHGNGQQSNPTDLSAGSTP